MKQLFLLFCFIFTFFFITYYQLQVVNLDENVVFLVNFTQLLELESCIIPVFFSWQIMVMTKDHVIHQLVSEERKGGEKAQRVTEVLSKSKE